MTQGMKTIIYPVRDLAAAKAVYSRLLGVEPTMDQAYYVGFDIGDQHVGLDPHGHSKGLTGPLAYWHVDDIDGSVKALVDAGATELQAVKDVGGGRRIAAVQDPDGNVIGLLQPA
jgi:predicted enzyme related to lactoylglutathione lyase